MVVAGGDYASTGQCIALKGEVTDSLRLMRLSSTASCLLGFPGASNATQAEKFAGHESFVSCAHVMVWHDHAHVLFILCQAGCLFA